MAGKSALDSQRAHYALMQSLPKWGDGTPEVRPNCADLSIAHLFDPVRRNGEEKERVEEAKQFCYGCPIWEQCLKFAETETHHGGVMAGEYWSSRSRKR